MTGHGGLLTVSTFTHPTKVFAQGDLTPDMPRELGFALQFSTEILWPVAQLRYPRVG